MSSFRSWLFAPLIKRLNNINRELIAMGAREDAADARFVELVALVRDANLAKDAEIAALRAELANADAEAEARVNAALEADSEFDADKKEAGNSALEELAGIVAEPPVEEEPAPVEDVPPTA